MKYFKFTLTVLLALLTLTACQHNTNDKTTVITNVSSVLFNADVITMNPEMSSAQAIAIDDGRIVAIGSDEDLADYITNARSTTDLQGQTVLPGFIDAHGHISFTSMMVAAPNVASPPVGPVKTIDDVIAVLEQANQQRPGDSLLMGFGYDDSLLAEQRHPTRADLDKVSTDRPIAIMHVSAHLMSCNSKCLEVAGISSATENPAGGVIRRIKNSQEPDGVLEESAMGAVFAAIPQPSLDLKLKLLGMAQDYYAAHGITTVQDGATQPHNLALLREAANRDLFKLDVVAYPVMSFMGDESSPMSLERTYQNRFRIGGIKLVLDGSPQGKTAWLTEPYFHPPHNQQADYLGYPIMPTEKVEGYVSQAFSGGIPVIAHANGDAAADQLITAVKKANQAHGNLDRRTVMIHAQTAREDQIDDMLINNMMPSYFSAHTFYWGDWHRDSVFGEDRAKRISPLKSTAEKGLRFTTHNDTPVVPPDMMRLLWASVNRETRSGKTLGPEQQISPYQALESVTIDAAYQYFEEADKGSLEVGKLADIVVLDKNPLSVPKAEIKDVQVTMTLKEGEVVFHKAE